MEAIELGKVIAELGAVGILMYWVTTLKADVKELKSAYDKKNDQHTNDLKTHNSEIQSIYQNVVGENTSLLKQLEIFITEWKKKQ